MSEEANDSDSSCEWTFVSGEGKPFEDLHLDEEDDISTPRVEPEKLDLASSSGELEVLSDRNEDPSGSQADETCRSDTSSDIEKIEEPFNLLEDREFNLGPLTDALGRSLSKCISESSGDTEHLWKNSVLSLSTSSKSSNSVENDFHKISTDESQCPNDDNDTEGESAPCNSESPKLNADIDNLMDNLTSDCCHCDSVSAFSDEGSSTSLISRVEDLNPSVTDNFSDESSIISNPEIPQDLNADKLIYRHMPNRLAKGITNFLILFLISGVLVSSIRHFTGSSSRRFLHKQEQLHESNEVHQSYVTETMAVQTDITTCFQQVLSSAEEAKTQPCIENINHWRLQLQELVTNNDLHVLMNTKHDSQDQEKHYQVLQVDLLLKQLDYIEAVVDYKEQQLEEKKVLQKVKDLEVENSDLKVKLQQEDAQDQKIMFMLMKENSKLKLLVGELQQKVLDDKMQIMANQDTKQEIGTLRDQINQLMIEKEDLHSTIARLRYGSPLKTDLPIEIQNNINKLRTENNDLMLEIGKLRYTKPTADPDLTEVPEMKVKKPVPYFEEFVHTSQQKEIPTEPEFSNKLLSSFTWIQKELYGILHDGHEVAKTLLNKTVVEYKKLKNNEALWQQINNKVSGVYDFFNSKWEHIQNSVPLCQPENLDEFDNQSNNRNSADHEGKERGRNVLNKFGNLFALFKKKCKDLGKKVAAFSPIYKNEHQMNRESPKEETLTTDEEIDHRGNDQYKYHFTDGNNLNFDKPIFECIGDACENIIDSDYPEDDDAANADWVFQRAWYRENKKMQAKAAEWLFDRARDRAQQREETYLPKHSSFDKENTGDDVPVIDMGDNGQHLKGDWYFKSKFHENYDHWDVEDDDNFYDDDDDDHDEDKFHVKIKNKYAKKAYWHPRTKYGYATQSEFSDHKFDSKESGKYRSKYKSKKRHCMHSKNSKPVDFDCFKYS